MYSFANGIIGRVIIVSDFHDSIVVWWEAETNSSFGRIDFQGSSLQCESRLRSPRCIVSEDDVTRTISQHVDRFTPNWNRWGFADNSSRPSSVKETKPCNESKLVPSPQVAFALFQEVFSFKVTMVRWLFKEVIFANTSEKKSA